MHDDISEKYHILMETKTETVKDIGCAFLGLGLGYKSQLNPEL